jgi:hypothetical protein
MLRSLANCHLAVKSMTLLMSVVFAAGCTYTQRHKEVCNSRAYLKEDIESYITSRFDSGAQVRMAIIPFSTPANLSWQNPQQQGLGRELAWKFQSEFLAAGSVPIVEVMNREDWPGKREEFWTGNFGALAQAREAGYDLVMVGNVDPMKTTDSLTIYSKIIDADAGVTIWSGATTVATKKQEIDRGRFGDIIAPKIRPDLLYLDEMINLAASCTTQEITRVN